MKTENEAWIIINGKLDHRLQFLKCAIIGIVPREPEQNGVFKEALKGFSLL